jgi:hypothetical protein
MGQGRGSIHHHSSTQLHFIMKTQTFKMERLFRVPYGIPSSSSQRSPEPDSKLIPPTPTPTIRHMQPTAKAACPSAVERTCPYLTLLCVFQLRIIRDKITKILERKKTNTGKNVD